MRLDLDNLPSDTALLHQLVRDMAGVVAQRNDEIERLQAIIKKLNRMQFGRSAERLDPDQLALGLEDQDIARKRRWPRRSGCCSQIAAIPVRTRYPIAQQTNRGPDGTVRDLCTYAYIRYALGQRLLQPFLVNRK